MTSSDEKIEKPLERVLTELERDSTREVSMTEDGSTKRLELRTVGWTRWIVAGPFLFVALWILVAAVVSVSQNQGAARDAVLPILVSASLAVIAVFLVAVRESVLITRDALVLASGIGRLQVTTGRIPLAAIRDVRVEAFRFASWDPYVVVSTELRRYRLAWSVSEHDAQEVARAIVQALPTGAQLGGRAPDR